MSKLFSEKDLKNIKVKNRVVLPPVVRFGWSDDNGYVTEKHIDHYEKIARGGTGLIIVEATCIDKDGRLAGSQLGIWSDDHIEGLSKIAEVCHKHGTVVLIQIHHAGLRGFERENVGPSEEIKEGKISKALTKDEILSIQDKYAAAVKRAKLAGFDGIELHGAHSYLIDQFMSSITNKREDEYGGSLENRMRFGLEVVRAAKKESNDNFIIGYRLGGIAPTLQEGIEIAKALEKEGVELLHVSAGIVGDELPVVPEGFPNNWIVYIGTEIKKNVSIPVIVVNGIRRPDQAAYLIENNMADFTAVAKAQLADPEWANKAREGKEIITCLECLRCQWFKDGSKCPRNIKQ